MLDERFVILGALLSFYGILSYLAGVLRGETKPNRVTWFFWALAPLIAFVAELGKGVRWQALMTFMVGFNPLIIFLASFVNKKAYWRLQRFDYFYGALALLGIVLWRATGEGNLAIFFALAADGLAAVPTLIKAYHSPETENYKAFLYAALSAAITLLTIDTWDFAHWVFPVYILTVNSFLVWLVRFRPSYQ